MYYSYGLKWISKSLLVMMMLLGVIMSIGSGNLFFAWFGLELKMLGIMPFIFLNSEGESKKEVKVGIYYFLVQVFGGMLFAWGSVLGKSSVLGIMGLCMKMGVSPFFWWVPSVMSRLDWYSMLMMSTMQKIPPLALIRVSFDLSWGFSMMVGLSGLLVACMGMKFSNKDLKLLMAWSSVGNMSICLSLVSLYYKMGMMFFMCYSSMVVLFVGVMMGSSNKLNNSSDESMKVDSFMNVSLFLLMFSGLPPFLGFVSKVYLLSGLSMSESDMMMKQMELLDNKNYMVEYPVYKTLSGWNLGLMVVALLVVQVVAYMKVFMGVYSSFSFKLEGSSRSMVASRSVDSFMMLMVLLSMVMLLI